MMQNFALKVFEIVLIPFVRADKTSAIREFQRQVEQLKQRQVESLAVVEQVLQAHHFVAGQDYLISAHPLGFQLISPGAVEFFHQHPTGQLARDNFLEVMGALHGAYAHPPQFSNSSAYLAQYHEWLSYRQRLESGKH